MVQYANPTRDVGAEFAAAIQAAGLTPPESLIPDGKLHRFASNGKHGDDAGWYVFHDDDFPAGAFGDWRSALSRTWRADIGRDLTPAEMTAHQAKVDAARRARDEEVARERAQARQHAAWILESAHPASAGHPYLVRKKVTPVPSLLEIAATRAKDILGYAPKCRGGPLVGRLLVVPVHVGGELSTVEFIDEAGLKSVLAGGAKGGGYWAAQPLPKGDGAGLTVLVGEGAATMLSARQATGYPAVAALTSGNLSSVAKAMRERFPKAVLVLLADLVKDTGEPDPHAGEAARAVGGPLAVPDFGKDRPEGATDFNDLAQHRGLEAVQLAIAGAKAPAGDAGRDSQTKDEKADDSAAAEVIETAIAKLATDIGAVFESEVITALKSVRESKPADYQRYRKRIKDAGASVAELDRLVCVPEEKGDGAQGAAAMFPDIEPWHESVDGPALLTDLADTVRRYVIVPWHGARAIALWIVFTHLIDVVCIAPILALTSPEKRCGKSTLLALLRHLVLRRMPCSNISAPSLFRAIETWAPTLLIDEADSFLRDNEYLRGVLNSGHSRDLAFVIRTVGDDHEPRRFSTWGAKAIALIGGLKDTLADRSIEVALKRKLPTEHVERLRYAEPEVLHTLARRCARWAADNAEKIRAARPEMPDGLHDRAQDNWEPLLAIADLAGGEWPELARKVALALSGAVDSENDTIRVQLLSGIREVFMDRGADCDRLPTVELIADLIALEGRPWGEANRGKPINPRWFAARVRPFGIVRGSKRKGEDTFKGYELDQFRDAFKRYLPPLPSKSPTSNRSHGHNAGGARVSEDFVKVTAEACDRYENGPKPSCGAGCDRVTDPKPPTQGEGYPEGAEDRDTGVIL